MKQLLKCAQRLIALFTFYCLISMLVGCKKIAQSVDDVISTSSSSHSIVSNSDSMISGTRNFHDISDLSLSSLPRFGSQTHLNGEAERYINSLEKVTYHHHLGTGIDDDEGRIYFSTGPLDGLVVRGATFDKKKALGGAVTVYVYTHPSDSDKRRRTK